MNDADAAAVPGRTVAEGAPSHLWDVLGRLEKTAIGRRGPDGAASVARHERPGALLFGPYWRLPGGAYRLSLRCRAGSPRYPGLPVLGVEIIAFNRNQQAWRDFTAAELADPAAGVDFTVPSALSLEAGEEAPFEFRFYHLGNADWAVDTVTLHRLDDASSMLPPPPAWRLLGRFRTIGPARRGRDGAVSAPRWRPSGLWLRGTWPHLRLSEGRYRLSLACGVGPPGDAAAPVVGIAVVGNSGRRSRGITDTGGRVALAWCDFTAAELADGPAECDFDVPPDWALEGGEDAPIELQLHHLGNAAVTVTAIGLRLRGEIAAPLAQRWRLRGRLRRRAVALPSGGGVAVRGEFRPGAFLGGTRSPLHLPTGAYRLILGLRCGVPRDPSGPVIAATVTQRGVWARRRVLARRTLTAAELAGGAALGFVVADGGCELRCDVVLEHFGNADLIVDDVTVATAADGDAAARRGSPPALRQVVVIGNCQAETVRQAFRRAPALARRFNARFHFVGLQKNLHAAAREELRRSDLLLVQDIRDFDDYPLRDAIPDGIETVKFPLLHFASLWPFDHYNGPGDSEAYDREWPNLTFLYHDGLLARLRRTIPDKEARFQAYRTLDAPDVVNYVRLHDFERRRLQTMDRRFDCTIGRFILDHFRFRQLFYTTNHPNRELVNLLMEWLMSRVGIAGTFPHVEALDHLKRLQVPIHPQVAADLDVTWADANTRYVYEGVTTNWEAYIRRYIDHYG